MSSVAIPPEEWSEFLAGFSQSHCGWLVRLEIHDLDTEENVSSPYLPLRGIELDTEDRNNPRITVTMGSDHKLIKHVLFRPSHLTAEVSSEGADESLHVESMNTSTTIRFRAAALPDASTASHD